MKYFGTTSTADKAVGSALELLGLLMKVMVGKQ